MLAVAVDAGTRHPLVEHPAGLLAVLLAVLAIIFWLTQRPVVGRLFKVVPALVFCYFVPTALTTAGVIPTARRRWMTTPCAPTASTVRSRLPTF